MTEAQLRQAVLNKASEYIGCVYGDQKIFDLYDLYNAHIPEFVQKWGTRSSKMLRSYTGYCALFVSAIQYMCGNVDIQPMEIAPYEMVANIARKRDGLWQPYGNGYVPQPGDNILFDWSGKRQNGQHIGFVYAYNAKTGIVTTLEGNATGVEKHQTVKRTFHKDDTSIMGYITPDYASMVEASEPTITKAEVSNVTIDGYTVTCEFNAPEGLKYVKMPTWTAANDQDDIVWHDAKVSGNTATYTVSVYSHNGEHGKYNTHIYVYDKKNQYAMKALQVDVPEPYVPTPIDPKPVDPQPVDPQPEDPRTDDEKILAMVNAMSQGDTLVLDSISLTGVKTFRLCKEDNVFTI